ncbi:MAG: hypothetical protein JW760_08145 [Spirochaetales bacterium]|nr:hypothetical protein [Spirochaetales bacterium]
MKRTFYSTFILCSLILAACFASCSLGAGRIDLYDQAITVALDLAGQSRGILPKNFEEEDLTLTYAGDSISGVSGKASLTGQYVYDYAYYYIDSDSNKKDRIWTYDDIVIAYDNFLSADDMDMTVVSGTLTVDGSQTRSTRYTGWASTTTESGSVSITGKVVVEGYCEGADIRDTVNIDLVYECIGGSWFYNGRIWTTAEDYDIVYE